MKILIVDDNANNRLVLNLLLQDYIKERKAGSYTVEECENGLEALNMSKQTQYDLIFMDIMMPEMDGIEATQKIRDHDKDVMIIAVSAIEDEKKQIEILRCGAEDYVPKPLDAPQLFARLDNYFSLLSRRHTLARLTNPKSVNLYTHEVYHRQTIFYIENDEALAEFWEYYLLGDEPIKVDGLSDVVRAVYALGDAIVCVSKKPWIIVEVDNENIYFTLNHIDAIGNGILKLIMTKNKEVSVYKSSHEKISFKLPKIITTIEDEIIPLVQMEKETVTEELVQEIPSQVKEKKVEISQTNVDEYRVFEYMDSEDKQDVEDNLGELSSLMLMLGNSELEENEIKQIASLLDALGRSLTVYTESYAIGQSLSNLSVEMFSNIENFKQIADDISTLSAAFVSDMQTWLKMTFYEGAPSADFMNDTIIVNTQTIAAMLHADDSSADEGDMDDIFDF